MYVRDCVDRVLLPVFCVLSVQKWGGGETRWNMKHWGVVLISDQDPVALTRRSRPFAASPGIPTADETPTCPFIQAPPLFLKSEQSKQTSFNKLLTLTKKRKIYRSVKTQSWGGCTGGGVRRRLCYDCNLTNAVAQQLLRPHCLGGGECVFQGVQHVSRYAIGPFVSSSQNTLRCCLLMPPSTPPPPSCPSCTNLPQSSSSLSSCVCAGLNGHGGGHVCMLILT